MCGNYEQKQYGMAHGSLAVAGMIVKSEASSGRAAVAGSSSPPATTAHNSAKMGSRRIFTPQFKLQVLDSYRNDGDCKGNQRATARKYGIHRRQIQKWLQVENNLRSVVANGGGNGSGTSSNSSNNNNNNISNGNSGGGSGSSSGAVSSVHSNGGSSSGNGGSASMKINLLNHHHHQHPHLHHPAHHVHHPAHHHLHYQPMHHHPHHHPGLTGLMQAPSVAAAAAAAAVHYHHQHHLHQQQQHHHQPQQPVHPLAFHPIAVPPVQHQQQQVGLDVVRQRVARNGASAAGLLSPILTHTGAASAVIPVSSCSPLSVASSTGSLSSSSLCSASPNSMARSPSSHQLLQLSDAASSGGDSVNQPHHHQQPSVIFSPVPLLAAASATSSSAGATDSHYYGHIRALAATAQAAAAAAVTAAAATAHRYDHPIDLSRPGSQSPVPAGPKTPREPNAYDRSVKEEQLEEGEEEEISVEEVDEQPFDRGTGMVEQAWDLSCRRSAVTPDRKRSASAMSGPIVTPDTSRPAKSVKLFKPYLLDEEEPQEKAPKQHHLRPDSALADDDKDSTRESPAIVDRPMSPATIGSHQQSSLLQSHHQQYPIIWSNSSPAAATAAAAAAYYELSPPAYLLASQSQTMLSAGGCAPAGTVVPTERGWSSPQASPVSGYDSSTSISSVCSGPEEDNTSHSSHSSSSHSHNHHHGQSEKLKQQAIDSFYHDVACRGDYRAVATKYNINRKYVEKWLRQEQEDDHHHQHHHHAEVRSPLVVG